MDTGGVILLAPGETDGATAAGKRAVGIGSRASGLSEPVGRTLRAGSEVAGMAIGSIFIGWGTSEDRFKKVTLKV